MDTRDLDEPADPRLASMIDFGLGRGVCDGPDWDFSSVGEKA
jgi:hypothetical protein